MPYMCDNTSPTFIVRPPIVGTPANATNPLRVMSLTCRASYHFVDRVQTIAYCATTGQEVTLDYFGPYISKESWTFQTLNLTSHLVVRHNLEATGLYAARINSEQQTSIPLILLPASPDPRQQYVWQCVIELELRHALQSPDIKMLLAWNEIGQTAAAGPKPDLGVGDYAAELRHIAANLAITSGMYLPCEVEIAGSSIHCAIILRENKNHGIFRASLLTSRPVNLTPGMFLHRTVRDSSERFNFDDSAIVGTVREIEQRC